MTLRLAVIVLLMITTSAVSDEHVTGDRHSQFLRLAKTIDELSETWPKNKVEPYRQAVARFPGLRACLADEDDLSAIRWTSFATLEELEVCLSLIHNAIGDLDESVDWFKDQGFSVSTRFTRRGSPPQKFSTIYADWIVPSSGPTSGEKSPLTGIRAWFRELLARSGLGIGLVLDSSERVTDVNAGYTRK